MRAQRGSRTAVWAAWLATSALLGLAVAPAVALLAAAGCAVVLGAEEAAYRRRARAYFARLHAQTLARHDAVLDAWMRGREDAAARPGSQLLDDVSRPRVAAFVVALGDAADLRDAVRARDYLAVQRYHRAVLDLDASWRALAWRARGLDTIDDARHWLTTHGPSWAPALAEHVVPLVRAASDAAVARFRSRVA